MMSSTRNERPGPTRPDSQMVGERGGSLAAFPIPGIETHQLAVHVDTRGFLTEFFRTSWTNSTIRQWTAISLGMRTIRGPSVHRIHTDAIVVITGSLEIGLRDLREVSPVFRKCFSLTVHGLQPILVFIPPGVMHTFYASLEPAVVMVGTTHEYDPEDDIRCIWQEAGLDLDESVVGIRDDRAMPLEDVIAWLHRRR